MKSDFFKKHIKYLSLAAVTLLTLDSCKDKPFAEKQPVEQKGLLDPTPQNDFDVYNTEITLNHVNIPVCNKHGEILPDRYILTKGQNPDDFAEYQNIRTDIVRKAFINGDTKGTYVKVGPHGELVDENGKFFGSIVELDGQIRHISPRNIAQYMTDTEKKNRAEVYTRKQQRASATSSAVKDSMYILQDTTQFNNVVEKDTTQHHKDIIIGTDTLNVLDKTYE